MKPLLPTPAFVERYQPSSLILYQPWNNDHNPITKLRLIGVFRVKKRFEHRAINQRWLYRPRWSITRKFTKPREACIISVAGAAIETNHHLVHSLHHIRDHRAFDSVTYANFRYRSAQMLTAREERNENDTSPLSFFATLSSFSSLFFPLSLFPTISFPAGALFLRFSSLFHQRFWQRDRG